MRYLGDIQQGATVHFMWSTNDRDGGAVTRTVDGAIRIYKDNQTGEETAGITNVEDFDGIIGIHFCSVDTGESDFYDTGHDYSVVLVGAVIDGQTVNADLASFSIENRHYADADIIIRRLLEAALVHRATTGDTRVDIEIDKSPYVQVPNRIKIDEHTRPQIKFTIYEAGTVRNVSGYTFTFAGFDDKGKELFSKADGDFNKTNANIGIVFVVLDAADTDTAESDGFFELKMIDADESERPIKGGLEVVESRIS